MTFCVRKTGFEGAFCAARPDIEQVGIAGTERSIRLSADQNLNPSRRKTNNPTSRSLTNP